MARIPASGRWSKKVPFSNPVRFSLNRECIFRYPPILPSGDYQNSKVKVLLTRDRSSSEWNVSSAKSTNGDVKSKDDKNVKLQIDSVKSTNNKTTCDVNDIDGLILPGQLIFLLHSSSPLSLFL